MRSLRFNNKRFVLISVISVFAFVMAACSPNTNIPVTGNEVGTPSSDLGNTNTTSNLNSNLNANANANLNSNLNTNANANSNLAMAPTSTVKPTVAANTNANANANMNVNANANTNANMNANANANLNANTNANMNANTNAGAIPVTGGAALAVATDPTLGKYLVDSQGMTLYMYTPDQKGSGKSVCDAPCLKYWPPLLAEGGSMTPGAAGNVNANANTNANSNANVTANMNANTNASGAMQITVTTAGIQQSLVGTADLPDGRKIVTYNGYPLYYYIKDKKPGDILGQAFAGIWWVLTPAGTPIESGAVGTPMPGNSNSNANTNMNANTNTNANMNANANTNASANANTNSGAIPVTGGSMLGVVNDPTYGPILTDSQGRTLYVFAKDQPGKSNCDALCLVSWPPLLSESSTSSTPAATSNTNAMPVTRPTVTTTGIDTSKLGTVTLTDGRTGVTYMGWPLYYFKTDKNPGDKRGEGSQRVWWMVTPQGKFVTANLLSTPVLPVPDNSNDNTAPKAPTSAPAAP